MRYAFFCLGLISCLALSTCSDDNNDELRDAAAEASVPDAVVEAGAPDLAGADLPQSQSNTRYCEIIPLYLQGTKIRADVWNTKPFNDCPQAAWDALDADTLKTDLGALFVRMNGPRHGLADEVVSWDLTNAPVKTFGTLKMQRFATFELDPTSVSTTPYTEVVINRDNHFRNWAGTEIYELLAPGGAAYVMISYALIVDPTLTKQDLPTLGSRLKLPTGWTYQARVLTQAMDVKTVNQEAVMIQDELQNSYQRYKTP